METDCQYYVSLPEMKGYILFFSLNPFPAASNVETPTLMQRDVALSLMRRFINVMCPLGLDPKLALVPCELRK